MEESLETVDDMENVDIMQNVESEEDRVSTSSSSDTAQPDDDKDNARKQQYRIASTFELGDDQPQEDHAKSRKRLDNSFQNLFGPPQVGMQDMEKNANVDSQKQTVTPLTEEEIKMANRKGYVAKIKPSKAKPAGRTTPGGHHSPLW